MTNLNIPVMIAGETHFIRASSRDEAIANFGAKIMSGEITSQDLNDALDGQPPAEFIGELYDTITGVEPQVQQAAPRNERTATVEGNGVTLTATASIVKNSSTGA